MLWPGIAEELDGVGDEDRRERERGRRGPRRQAVLGAKAEQADGVGERDQREDPGLVRVRRVREEREDERDRPPDDEGVPQRAGKRGWTRQRVVRSLSHLRAPQLVGSRGGGAIRLHTRDIDVRAKAALNRRSGYWTRPRPRSRRRKTPRKVALPYACDPFAVVITATDDPQAAATEQRDLVIDGPRARPPSPLEVELPARAAATRPTPHRCAGTIECEQPQRPAPVASRDVAVEVEEEARLVRGVDERVAPGVRDRGEPAHPDAAREAPEAAVADHVPDQRGGRVVGAPDHRPEQPQVAPREAGGRAPRAGSGRPPSASP